MSVIGTLVTFVDAAVIEAADFNLNFNEIKTKLNTFGVFTDVARTITAAMTFAAGAMIFAVTADVGSVAAPARDGYFSGKLVIGAPASVASASAGDVVLKNLSSIRASNAAGSATLKLIGSGGLDETIVGNTSGYIALGGGIAGIAGVLAGEVVMGNSLQFKGVNFAGNAAIGMIKIDTSDRISIAAGGQTIMLGASVRFSQNNTGVIGRNVGDTDDLDLIRTTAGDLVVLGSNVLGVNNGVLVGAIPTSTAGIATGDLGFGLNNRGLRGANAANSAMIQLIQLNLSDRVSIAQGGTDIQLGRALVALGGGAAPTFGTIGGSGPATAAQNTWFKFFDSTGAAIYMPVWK